ncbi:4'-phosphopantetheinyl transferase Npt [Rhodococcus tukisamuensis]|uniref:4'-phosphopantetheinyl transferase EntD (Siderophore biosynthesis) n=1 Tax=Rhodococcus tukisamuensis TaxID=168276 RepID=A0A1G6R869_9NOCA|nr:4'-phosphopantetheinyl transferase Npt [Rhodococcus tukisamuensis]SDD00641.1 4'-phosphopantetheinyl transferase EntD (siderophore biosynthesis) [Rhodococcus tukisamuensis]
MIEQILPTGVVAAELFEDPPGLTVHPQEEALIARAVDKRRREFTSARHCARVALGKLGVEPAPILRGERGVPRFPRGVVGSLTHCDGYRAAVLGFAMQVRSVGIDAEPHGPLPDGVLDAVSLPEERAVLAARADGSVHWDRLLFCAKEATYKAWFPLTERWLGFEDARITFATTEPTSDGGAHGTFHSELLVPGQTLDGPPLASLDGRWLVSDGLVITAITVQ